MSRRQSEIGKTAVSKQLEQLRDCGWERLYPSHVLRLTVGMSTCGKAAGGDQLVAAIPAIVQELEMDIEMHEVGCSGWCWAEPLLEVQIPGGPRGIYGKVEASDIKPILAEARERRILKRKLLGIVYRDRFELLDSWVQLADTGPENLEYSDFLLGQSRHLMSSWGHIEPSSVEEYAAVGGYRALAYALNMLTPEALIDEVEKSGLRGRGGAGFPTGKKWRAAFTETSSEKYVIANADEGDPGAYMDRGLMESCPHQLIEGMIIAGYAIGADKGYIFTRSEYPHAVAIMKAALKEAGANNLLGEDILGTGFSFSIDVICSAGAYVCGEATAMVSSMEGRRPDPRIRPPRMTEEGLWHVPTCVNNVETLADVPIVVCNGADYFRRLGTEKSSGTKVFSLVGSVKHTGLIEMEMGASLQEVVESIGDTTDISSRRDKTPIARSELSVQIGGPSGAILPLGMEGLTLDYEGLRSAGGIMGSGGIVVLGREACVVDIANYFLHFSLRESCGKCTACREGLAICCEILDRVVEGISSEDELMSLEEICRYIADNSLCALGKMAPTPVLSSLRYYRDVYEKHIHRSCPTEVCRNLMHFEIDPKKCPKSCTSCKPSCPANAIIGHYGEAFVIDQNLCTKCWMCTAQCPYGALNVFPEPYAETRG